MAVLGIVLILLAVLLGLGVAVSSTASTTMEVFGVDFGVLVPTVFFLGAAAGAILVVGLWLTKKGLARGYRRRKEVRELRQQAAASDTTTDSTDTSRQLESRPDTAPEYSEPAGTAHAGAAPDPLTGPTPPPEPDSPGRHAANVPADVPPASGRRTVAEGTEPR